MNEGLWELKCHGLWILCYTLLDSKFGRLCNMIQFMPCRTLWVFHLFKPSWSLMPSTSSVKCSGASRHFPPMRDFRFNGHGPSRSSVSARVFWHITFAVALPLQNWIWLVKFLNFSWPSTCCCVQAELAACLKRDGFKSVQEAVGADCRS